MYIITVTQEAMSDSYLHKFTQLLKNDPIRLSTVELIKSTVYIIFEMETFLMLCLKLLSGDNMLNIDVEQHKNNITQTCCTIYHKHIYVI